MRKTNCVGRNRHSFAARSLYAPLDSAVMHCCTVGVAILTLIATYGHAACLPSACYAVTFDVIACSNAEEGRGRVVANLRIKPTEVREVPCYPDAASLKGDAQRRPPRWDGEFQIPFWLGVEMHCSALPRTMRKLWRPKCCDVVGQMHECAAAPHTLDELPSWAK